MNGPATPRNLVRRCRAAARHRAAARRTACGMTLIEMTVSLAMMTVIVGGSASLVLVASRALSNEASNVGGDAMAARAATDRVVDDLKVATAVTERAARAITMTVPDRTGDNQPETIRYAWGGAPGDPLTRSVNSGPAGIVAANVRALNFNYLSKTAGRPPPVEGPEVVHKEHLAATSDATDVTSTKAVAEYFKPTLPDKVVSWKLGRCRVYLGQHVGSVGTVTVTVKYADAAMKPTPEALQSASVTIAGLLDGGGWVDLSFAAPFALNPAKGVCLVITCQPTLGTGGKVYFDTANGDATIAWMTSSDGGTTWGTPTAVGAMLFRAWGTATTQEEETLEFQPLPAAP